MSQNGESNPPPQGEPGNTQPVMTPSPLSVEPLAHVTDPVDAASDSPGNTVHAAAEEVSTDDDTAAPGNSMGEDDPSPGNEATPGNEIHPRTPRQGTKGAQPRGGAQGQRGNGRRDGSPQGPRGNRAGGDPNGQQHRAFHTGDKVRAKILALGTGGALVDLWGKERGVLDLRELSGPDAPAAVVGNAVDVIVLQDGTRGGNLVVTRDPNRAERNREMIAQAFTTGEPIEGLITGLNRGGLEVDIGGTRAFCPSSHVDLRLPSQQEMQSLVLRREFFKITQVTEGGREAVVSRRALREADFRERAEEAVTKLSVGDRVTGRVVAVRDHGIFVDLGGVEGRIQLSELSYDRGARPGDIARVGDEIECVVLRIDTHVPSVQPPAVESTETVEAAGEGVEQGPSGDSPVGKDNKDSKDNRDGKGKPRKRFTRVPEGTPRVELSHRAVETDPWADIHKRYPVGSVHKGKVARMQPFGAFIELEKGVDGLLHVSEISERRIQHPNEVLKDGQEVSVRVARIDREQRKIALGLIPEGFTEEQLKTTVTPRVGLITQAKITEHDTFGVWAQIDNALGKVGRGLILPQDSNQPKGTDLRKALPVGAEVKVKVVELDRGRLKLSIRAALQDEERQAYRAYQQQTNSTSVGVSLADKLRKLGLGKPG